MLIQKSDGRHIAVKTQCNSTPNGSPQFTVVPLQDWAVFIVPSSYNLCISPLSSTSLRSVTSEDSCNIPSCLHMALQGIDSCQHHCDVWTDTTDLLKCYIYLYYFWYHLGTANLSGKQYYHTLCCMSAITTEHLPGGPSTRSIKTSTVAALKHGASLSVMRQGPPILVSSMGLTHHHNSGFNFICSGS